MKTLYKKDSKGKIRQWSIIILSKHHKIGIGTSDGLVEGKQKDWVFKEAVPNNQFKTPLEKAEANLFKAALSLFLTLMCVNSFSSCSAWLAVNI